MSVTPDPSYDPPVPITWAWLGTRLGAYEIVSLLGRGGMGKAAVT
jgi:hypothetical protein